MEDYLKRYPPLHAALLARYLGQYIANMIERELSFERIIGSLNLDFSQLQAIENLAWNKQNISYLRMHTPRVWDCALVCAGVTYQQGYATRVGLAGIFIGLRKGSVNFAKSKTVGFLGGKIKSVIFPGAGGVPATEREIYEDMTMFVFEEIQKEVDRVIQSK